MFVYGLVVFWFELVMFLFVGWVFVIYGLLVFRLFDCCMVCFYGAYDLVL